MKRTDYGYFHHGRPVRLTLIPAVSPAHEWCAGGNYIGAVYAVPHKPACSYSYPCSTASVTLCKAFETPPPCVLGTVPAPLPTQVEQEEKERAKREATERAERETRSQGEREAREKADREAIEDAPYTYPGGLPKPLDPTVRLVATFRLRF